MVWRTFSPDRKCWSPISIDWLHNKSELRKCDRSERWRWRSWRPPCMCVTHVERFTCALKWLVSVYACEMRGLPPSPQCVCAPQPKPCAPPHCCSLFGLSSLGMAHVKNMGSGGGQWNIVQWGKCSAVQWSGVLTPNPEYSTSIGIDIVTKWLHKWKCPPRMMNAD